MLQAVPAALTDASADEGPQAVSAEKPVHVVNAKIKPRQTVHTVSAPRTPKAAWPAGGSATLTLQAPNAKASTAAKSSAATGTMVKAGKLPVRLASLTGSTTATVRVLDHSAAAKAGIDGVLMSVTGAAGHGGQTQVSLDYSAFAGAAGAGYGKRLHIVQLPACALTTPALPQCRNSTPLKSTNNEETQTVTTDAVDVPATSTTTPSARASTASAGIVVLGATTGPASLAGDYKASPLTPASTWSTSLNSGSFSWNYNMPVPAVPGGLLPDVGLAYSSGAVDGRTSNGNNQGSWAGDGFDMDPGFVERSYKPCGDDGVKTNGVEPGDMCWAYDNATISFAGHAGELIPVSADEWRIKGDDGTKVIRTRDLTRGNGDNDGEYFEAITTNGTRYYFGYNRLTNWTTGNPETKSVETVPVFGDDATEPCHAATFADSWCQQGWRWNLDLVIDPTGNDITYWYNPETNSYGRNLKASDDTPYIRAATLDHIEYGQQSGDIYSGTIKPMAKVSFATAERCLETTASLCNPANIDTNRQYWYDTPWDMNCKAGTDCDAGRYSPTFWTRTRLTGVTTQTLQTNGTYKDIDSWALHHTWGTADNDYQLLLDSVTHTGLAGTAPAPLPPTTLGYDVRQNRLDKTGDGRAPFFKQRLSSIDDESGGQTDVNYSQAACDWDNLPTPQSNTTRCFPQMYQPTNDVPVTTEWFNKYVVDAVISTDRTGGAPDMVTHYSYLDGGAWAYDDDEGLTKEKLKTWSQWRGHGHVRVETGGTAGMSTQADHYFLRGMDGDRNNPTDATKTRTIQVPDGEGTTLTDDEAWSGFEYRTETYDRPGGKILEKSVNTPWKKQTASRVRDWGTTTANMVATSTNRSFTSLDNGAGSLWREARSNTTHDAYGRAAVSEALGDVSVTSDDQCTRTTYADNTTAWIFTGAIRTETVAGACSASVNRDTQPDGTSAVISDVRVRYDNKAYGVAPTKGLASLTETLQSRHGTTATYLDNAATYDSYGRPLSSTTRASSSVFDPTDESKAPVTTVGTTADTKPRTTLTTYTPTTGRPTKVVITTPPANATTSAGAETSTTAYEPLRGLPSIALDPALLRTDVIYDALGRPLKVWLPNRSKGDGQTPNSQFVYNDADTDIRSVATKTLNNDASQDTSYALYDGFGRIRQTQSPGADGGRILTDTFYDERGQAKLTYAPYYAESAPSGTLSSVDDTTGVETQTASQFDGLGRVTQSTLLAGNGVGTVLSKTITTYGGNSVTVTPPKGGTPTTTFSDVAGHVTELRQYKADTPVGAFDATAYQYDHAGRLAQLTDPSHNVWTWTYDQSGNLVNAADPDSGSTSSKYNDRGELVSTTDARTKTVTHVYDNLSREIETHDGTATGPLLTSQVWDPTGALGHLASSTRYVTFGGTTYQYKNTVNTYDALYRAKKTTLTVPSIPGETAPAIAGQQGLAGNYSTITAYNLDGTVQSTSYPAVGNLSAEVVAFTYDTQHRPATISSNLSSYLAAQSYDLTDKPLKSTLNAGGKNLWVTNSWEWGTQRLHGSRTDQQDVTGAARATQYTYDEAGDVTSLADASRTGTDLQCFSYDYLARLTEAFTPAAGSCPTAPAGAALGGPAPYWSTYAYNTDGTRSTETQHNPAGATAPDTTRTYSYPATSSGPHTLKSVATAVGTAAAVNETYTYDSAGNTLQRHLEPKAGTTDDQTLVWGTDGTLNQATDAVGTTTGTTTITTNRTTDYVYGTDGSRLTEHTVDTANPAAENTTLYLGNTEVNYVKGAAKPTATRYYPLGAAVAVRSDDNKITFQVTDAHGTADANIDAATGALTQHYETPFGTDRGPAPTVWAGTRGFIGGTKDTATGLTHLGARDYEPATGRFISVDPLLVPDDPQSLAAYTYSNNNPLTFSDPTGQRQEECSTGANQCTGDNHHVNDVVSDIQDRCAKGHCSDGTQFPPHGDTSPAATAEPATVEVYPTVVIPRDWDNWLAFATALDKRISKDCELDGSFYCNDPNQATSKDGVAILTQRLSTDIFMACSDVGGCPKNIYGSSVSDLIGANFAAFGGSPDDWAGEGNMLKGEHGGGDGKGTTAPKGCNSFPAGTLVLLADGTVKPIDKLKVGDQVESTDPESSASGSRAVDATIVNPVDTDFTTVTVTYAGKTNSVTATDHHPFWSPSARAWIDAADLKPGMTLRTSDGDNIAVVAVTHLHRLQAAYNLTVRDLHTYYVLAGGTPVLVHNSNSNCGIRPHDKARGAAGVDEMTDTFEKFYDKSDIYSESYGNGLDLWTPYGRRQVDIAVRNPDGNLHLYEVKVNKSNYTRGQRRKDEWLAKTYGFETSVVRRGTDCPICNP